MIQCGEVSTGHIMEKTFVCLCYFNRLLRGDCSNHLVYVSDCKKSTVPHCTAGSLLMLRQKLGHIDRLHV